VPSPVLQVGRPAVRSDALAGERTTLDDVSGTVSRALRQQGEDDITLVLARVRS
jgi:hypothetical protein